MIMPIQLGYDEVRGLAKRLKLRTGVEVKLTEILADIAAVVGRPMDGMMHALKHETRGPLQKKSASESFKELPVDEVTGLPTVQDALGCLNEIVETQPPKTKGGLLRVSVENTARLSSEEFAKNINDVAIAFKSYCHENEGVFVASLGTNEFVALITEVSNYDLVTDTIRGIKREMLGHNGSKRFPDGAVYVVCACPIEFDVEDLLVDCSEFIENVRPDLRPLDRFVWNDPEGAFEW